ncbi:MAG: T9SS C-terminal target domain-containing protein, partial [Chitinophagia bacterium]|nr:T9SS C-terminal target domain-containing protein [Chitinophagia bacterium]
TVNRIAGDSVVCTDSCALFTGNANGFVDSVRWTVSPAGAIVDSPTSYTTRICLPAAGHYSVVFTAYRRFQSDTAMAQIAAVPNPHPVVTRSGSLFSVTHTYSSYQWYSGSSLLPGATNATYVATTSGTYHVVVDSGGCKATSAGVLLPLEVATASGNEWTFVQTDATVGIYRTQPDGPLYAELYDLRGVRLATTTTAPTETTATISTAGLPAGLYILRVRSNTRAMVYQVLCR